MVRIIPLTKKDLLKMETDKEYPFVMASAYEIEDKRFFKKFKNADKSKSLLAIIFFSNVDEVYKFLEKFKAKKIEVKG